MLIADNPGNKLHHLLPSEDCRTRINLRRPRRPTLPLAKTKWFAAVITLTFPLFEIFYSMNLFLRFCALKNLKPVKINYNMIRDYVNVSSASEIKLTSFLNLFRICQRLMI